MSYILPEGRIMILKQPISGRYGIPRLMAYITANSSRFGWDGVETISVITFNRFRTRLRIPNLIQLFSIKTAYSLS